jgi:hypothetical protein
VFQVDPDDSSVIQMLIRWGASAGYQTKLNGVVVTNTFPKHTVAYSDAPISLLTQIKPKINLSKAVFDVRANLIGTKKDASTFEALVDSQNQTIFISSKVKTP